MEARLAAKKSPCERLLKVRFPDIYWSDNQMAYYNFCQQYKNYFAIAGAKKLNCISFAAFFL